MSRVLSCSSLPLTHLPLPEALGRLAAMGFESWELPIRGDGVHLGHLDPGALLASPEMGERFTRDVRAVESLRLVSAGFEIDRRSDVAREEKLLDACAALLAPLGCRTMTVFAFDDGAAPNETRLPALARVLSRYGMRMVIETHKRTTTQDPVRALALCEAMQVSLNLDHSHYIGQGYELSVVKPLLPHVVALQVRGCGPGALEAAVEGPADEGLQAWRRDVLEALPAETPVTIEYIDRQRNWEPSLRNLRALIRGE